MIHFSSFWLCYFQTKVFGDCFVEVAHCKVSGLLEPENQLSRLGIRWLKDVDGLGSFCEKYELSVRLISFAVRACGKFDEDVKLRDDMPHALEWHGWMRYPRIVPFVCVRNQIVHERLLSLESVTG